MRAYQNVFLESQESFSVKRNARNHRVYKKFRRYTLILWDKIWRELLEPHQYEISYT
jgi:hypothetical protein